MSAKRIQLTIPTPCQQRWQDMRPAESGRFCDSCQKTVVDFAAMTDQQIGAYFSNKPKNVCGRFTDSQLNRDVVIAQNAPTSAMKQRWLGFMTAGLLSWSTAQGQSTQLPDKYVLVSAHITPEFLTTLDRIEEHVTPTSEDSTWVITGQVIAETDKAPLPGVSIIIKGTNRGTTTDASGIFKLTLPSHDDRLVLSSVFIGYVAKEIIINLDQKLPLVVSLAEDPALRLTGEVVCIRKPTFFQKLKSRFKAGH